MDTNKFLFVYGNFFKGGTEFLIIRKSNWLVSRGFKVSIVLNSNIDKDMVRLLDTRVVLISLSNKDYNKLRNPFYNNRFIKKIKPDVIHSFDSNSAYIGYLFWLNLNFNCVNLVGIYHPEDYFWNNVNTFNSKLHRIVFSIFIDDSNKIFMNKECKLSNEKYFKRKFNSIIIPLPVNLDGFAILKVRPKNNLIVSVGRIDSYKTYNFYMLDVVEELCNEGHDITYNIYGWGELESELLNRIDSMVHKDKVRFLGPLKHESFVGVLKDAFLFVGMGTAVIEASASGTPSIVAIMNSQSSLTHGYLFECEKNNVGEFSSLQPLYNVKDKILQLLVSDKNDYLRIGENCKLAALDFESNHIMNYYINFVLSISKQKVCNLRILYLRFLFTIYYSVMFFLRVLNFFKNYKGFSNE